MSESDISSLVFVDTEAADSRWRVVLYAPPGSGKTVAACSAPAPIVALSADRPGAYRFARAHFAGKDIREARFTGPQSLRDVYEYVRANEAEVASVVLDPFGNMYDETVKAHTRGAKPDWQKVNDVMLGAVRAFRDLDVNLILVAHERSEGDDDVETKVFPNLGGPALIQRLMAEVDIVARIGRKDVEGEAPVWLGQFVTARGYQCKDSSGALGRTRPVDLTEWFDAATAGTTPDTSDVPFSPDFDEAASDALDLAAAGETA